MKKENHVTAFYIEVLLLTVGLIGIVLVLTQIFALGRHESAEARELTDAVCLAQNAAALQAVKGHRLILVVDYRQIRIIRRVNPFPFSFPKKLPDVRHLPCPPLKWNVLFYHILSSFLNPLFPNVF